MSLGAAARNPTVRTGLLSLLLMSGAAGLAALSARSSTQLLAAPALLVALTIAFFLSEQFLVNVEFRRQSHSLTFAGVPLVIAILGLPVHEVVMARLVGSLVALLWQRVSAEKVAYNLAAYTFEGALASTLVGQLVIRPGAPVDVLTLGGTAALVLAVDQLMSMLVLGVIAMHGGRMPRREVAGVLLQSALISLIATAFGSAMSLLLSEGAVGDLLVGLLIAGAIAAYGGYATTTRRHHSLTTVHEFVSGEESDPGSVDDLLLGALIKIRRILRAEHVEIVVADRQVHAAEGTVAGHALRVEVDENDEFGIEPDTRMPTDLLRAAAVTDGLVTVVPRATKDPLLRHWLADRGMRDAVVVPMTSDGETFGVVTVSDRLGETASFTESDAEMLRTLASHLAVALRSARLVERLAHQALHDPLTGLPNRALLTERIAEAGKRGGQSLAVLLLDLNKFKDVNDVLGHAVGDRLLTVVASRLRECVPAQATVARLGGDEFAVLVAGGDAATLAPMVAERVRDELVRPVRLDEATLTPDASIGIAVLRGGVDAGASGDAYTDTYNDLMRRADTAMYVAKTRKQGIALYHPDMDKGRAKNLALIADLRIALDHHPEQFTLVYQPKLDIASGEVVSAEALVRWWHPSLGVITPDVFIPLAEATDLIGRLTEHVLTTALHDCARWIAAGHVLGVAVNLSAGDLADDDLVQLVAGGLADAGLPPQRLTLEITESIVMKEPDKAVAVCKELAGMGIDISLDDFGTGYSSLSYLQRLPVAELKIDRSFVVGLGTESSAHARALIGSVAALAQNLGLRVVAEGVETSEQFEELRSAGCDVAQGYLISRPITFDDLRAWLERDTHATLTLVS